MSNRLSQPMMMAVVGALSSVVAVLAHQLDNKARPTGVRSRSNDQGRGARWLDDCLGDPTQLFQETRLRPAAWHVLIEYMKSYELVGDGRISMEEKILTFLYICSNGASWRNTMRKVGHSMESISRNFHEVLDALLPLYKDVVKSPEDVHEVPERIRDDPKRYPFFEDCIGALDGTQIAIHVPVAAQRRYRNRHGDLTQNVLAVVDFDMNFMYLLPGWEGSAHDGRVLKSARDKGFAAPPGKYFVADAGYVNSNDIMVPYRGVRYHLREIYEVGMSPATPQELFNYRHSSLRNIVERCFGVFKRRWRIFDRPHEFDIKTQVKLVYALAALHNLINLVYKVDEDLDEMEEYEGEGSEHLRRDAETDGDFDAGDPGIEERRDRIAEDMWEQYITARRVVYS